MTADLDLVAERLTYDIIAEIGDRNVSCYVAAGATIDYVVDLIFHAKAKADPEAQTREETAKGDRKPEDLLDWLIFIFHKLSRADFCVIVLVLVLFDVVWVLLPLGAIGAQAYWVTDLFQRARGWHT